MEHSQPLICVPVCARTIAELESAALRAAEVADVVELRIDCLEDFEPSDLTTLRSVADKIARPLILTFRPTQQGGHRQVVREARRTFWKQCSQVFKNELFDVELDLLIDPEQPVTDLDWNRVICSYHDFSGVPSNLAEIYRVMEFTRARYLKIAVAAADAVECTA